MHVYISKLVELLAITNQRTEKIRFILFIKQNCGAKMIQILQV